MIRQLRNVVSVVRKDARTSSRDQLVIYLLLSPFLLGLLIAMIMPALEQASLEFAVDASLAPEHVEALAEQGKVEQLPDRAAVERRVLQRDDLLGVVGRSDAPGYEVIAQGDEPEALRGLPHAILDRATRLRAGPQASPPVAELELVSIGSGRPELRRIITSLFGFSVTVIVGMMLGFAILEEKLTETARVYAVSPLRFGEYFVAKLGLGLVLSLVLVIPAIALPFGWDNDWARILLVIIASSPFALSLGLIIGMLAKDQLGAIAVMKAAMPIWMSLPVLGFVLPDAWQWTQWPFSNHWAVQALYLALGRGEGVEQLALLSFVTGVPVLAVCGWLLRRRLGFVS